jgi:hypothetical protein
MRVIEEQTFDMVYDNGGQLFSDLHFRRCKFVSSGLSVTTDPALRSTVRNVVLERCSVQGCTLRCAVVEDVVVDGLSTSDLHQSRGAVFKHVVLRGRVGRLMATARIATVDVDPADQRAFDAANAAYYEGVDWALDISQALSSDLSIRGIPAHLIRRDPETQVVVSREAALAGEWRALDRVAGTELETAMQFMLNDGYPDVVLIAHKLAPDFGELKAGIDQLRAAGIAEPD